MRQRLTPPRFLIELVIGVILLIAAGVGALIWRLSEAPLALDRLTPIVEQALQDRFPSLSVAIGGGVSLAWDGSDHALTLVAHDLSIAASGGVPLLIPELSLSFDRARLLRGEMLPRSITVLGLRGEVARDSAGQWSVAGLASSAEPANTGAEWLTTALRGEGPIIQQLAGLDRIGVRGAGVMIRDRISDQSASVEGLDFGFKKLDGAWSAAVSARIVSQSLSLGVRGAATLGVLGWAAQGKLELDPAELTALRRAAEVLALTIPPPLALMDGRLVLSMEARATWNGEAIAVTEATGKGVLSELTLTQEPETGIAGRIEHADLGLAWDGDRQALRADLTMTSINLTHTDIPAGAIMLRSIAMSGVYDRASDALQDGKLAIDSSFLGLNASVSATDIHGAMPVTVQAKTGPILFEDLRKYWPAGIAPNPRAWMLANIGRGTITGVTVKAVMARTASDDLVDLRTLEGSIEANGMRIRYIPRMPVVEQASGVATFDLKRFDIALSSGSVLRQRLTKGRIEITGLHLFEQQIAFDLTLAGPLASALDILDSPPLGYVKRFGIPLNEVAGDVTTRLLVKFPLLNAVTFDDVKIQATAEASGVRFARLVRGLDLSEGAFRVKVDQDALALSGRASMMGQAFQVEWAESFLKAPPQRRTLTVAGEIDGPLRQALGVDLSEFIQGPAGLRLAYVGQDMGRARTSAVLDLRRATVTVEPLGYLKPIGAAAELRVDVALMNGAPQTIDQIRYTAENALANGRGRFSPEGEVNRVDFDRLRLGETDLALSYLQSSGGVLISALGENLDLRALLKDKPDKPLEPSRPVRVDVKVASVRVSDDIRLSAVEGRVEHDGVRTRSAELSARADGGPLRVVIRPGQGGRDLLVEAEDSGTLIAALGLSTSVRGGKLRMSGWFDDRRVESPLQGRLEISDSRIVGAPILSRLLQLASITGIPELLSGDGVAFQTINADFTMLNEIIDVKELRASGLALGVLLRGKADRGKDVLDLTGTLVPIYGLNRVLGAIPLLGDLLTGGGGGGLFAFTFAVRGNATNPELSVNPLSVLAPGLLRRLFEYEPAGDPRKTNPPVPFPKPPDGSGGG